MSVLDAQVDGTESNPAAKSPIYSERFPDELRTYVFFGAICLFSGMLYTGDWNTLLLIAKAGIFTVAAELPRYIKPEDAEVSDALQWILCLSAFSITFGMVRAAPEAASTSPLRAMEGVISFDLGAAFACVLWRSERRMVQVLSFPRQFLRKYVA